SASTGLWTAFSKREVVPMTSAGDTPEQPETAATPPATPATPQKKPGMKWYAVRTYSGYENKAKKGLEDRIRLESLGEVFGEILVPTETVQEMVKGTRRTTKRKPMPGYILVQMVLSDRTFHAVK